MQDSSLLKAQTPSISMALQNREWQAKWQLDAFLMNLTTIWSAMMNEYTLNVTEGNDASHNELSSVIPHKCLASCSEELLGIIVDSM